jgi:hypothetical protein
MSFRGAAATRNLEYKDFSLSLEMTVAKVNTLQKLFAF